MSIKTNREKRQAEIDNIARTLKTDISELIKHDLRNKLYELVLEEKGFRKVFEFKENTIIEDNDKFEKFDEMVFFSIMRYCEKAYGKLDEDTHEPIPFMKLFNSAWNMKKHDIHRLKANPFNRSCKEAAMKVFLDDCCKRKGIKIKKRFNVLQIDKVEAWLLDNGFGEKELAKANSIINNSYVVADEIPDKDDDEQCGLRLSDTNSWANYGIRERALDALVEKAKKAYQAAGEKNFKLMRYLLTIRYAGHEMKDASWELYLGDLFDKELLDFIKEEGYPEDEASTLGKYLGIKRDTARKKLRAMKDVLEELDKKGPAKNNEQNNEPEKN